METVRFADHLDIRLSGSEGVYVTGLFTPTRKLVGEVAVALANALHSPKSTDRILKDMAHLPAENVRKSIELLVESGILVRSSSEVAQDAGYWTGIDASRRLESRSERPVGNVALHRSSKSSFSSISATFSETGLNLVEMNAQPDLVVLDSADYTDPQLQEYAEELSQSRVPWLLVSTRRGRPLIGPLFLPELVGCIDCLRSRLLANRAAEVTSGDDVTLVSSSRTAQPAMGLLAYNMVALMSAEICRAIKDSQDVTKLPIFDWIHEISPSNWQIERHFFARRPQCATCGDPSIVAKNHWGPIKLGAAATPAWTDGGLRSMAAWRFLDANEKLVSPITGAVRELKYIESGTDSLHVYASGPNLALQDIGSRASNPMVGLRSDNYGKGETRDQAKAGALGEALERYSAVFQGDEAVIQSSYSSFTEGEAIHPNEIHGFSDEQFKNRVFLNEESAKKHNNMHKVGEKLDDDRIVEWTPVWSLTNQVHKYAPTSAMFYGFRGESGYNAGADSNGCAAGSTLEEAILQGFFEIVERDAVAIWWYNMVQRPEIDLESFNSDFFNGWKQTYADFGRKVWLVDLTSDLGIPVVAAMSSNTDPEAKSESILIAFGAHFDIRIAISRAMTEVNQFFPSIRQHERRAPSPYQSHYTNYDQMAWWDHATVEQHRYLVPNSEVRRASDYSSHKSESITGDVERAVNLCAEAGIELLALDQTRPDIGVSVVRVLAPGMRHFWPRYAPGRLFDVPVDLGWIESRRDQKSLNPVAMFI
jgi:bacteriocin biosynthesis cyclodehydratase domain-containing protein